MVTIRTDERETDALTGRIRRLLESRPAVDLREASRLLGEEDGTVKAELENMVRTGEVERLRPVDYAGEEFDFFRLRSPIPATVQMFSQRVWREIRDVRLYARWAG